MPCESSILDSRTQAVMMARPISKNHETAKYTSVDAHVKIMEAQNVITFLSKTGL